MYGGGKIYNIDDEYWARQMAEKTKDSDLNASYLLSYDDHLNEKIDQYENHVSQHLSTKYHYIHRTSCKSFFNYDVKKENKLVFEEYSDINIDSFIFSHKYDRLQPCIESYLGFEPIEDSNFYLLYSRKNTILISENTASSILENSSIFTNIRDLIGKDFNISINNKNQKIKIAGIYKENFYSRKINNYFGEFVLANQYSLMPLFQNGFIATELTPSTRLNLKIRNSGGLFENFDDHKLLTSENKNHVFMDFEFKDFCNEKNINYYIGVPLYILGIVFSFITILLYKKYILNYLVTSFNNPYSLVLISSIFMNFLTMSLIQYGFSNFLLFGCFFGSYTYMAFICVLIIFLFAYSKFVKRREEIC